MPLSALSRIKHNNYIITSLYGELNKISTYIAGVDWPFIKITDCHQLPIEIYSKFVLPNSPIIGRMLKMPVTDIQIRDFGMMGQAHCTVGLMCTAKCLQSSTALQTIPTKISYFYSTIFIDYDQYFAKFGIYKTYTHCTYYYLHWEHQTMQLASGMIIF